ncbi:hypothetical protein [Burkholderia cepacia]|uniref:hypothetical protein n=1 Tax=Burkholderia cepacia TaxID=292 RepID=UPI00075D4B3A|nr:hypothetical protein [Burkholderia cepacia]
MDAQQQLIEQLGEAVSAPIAALNVAFAHLVQQLDNARLISKLALADGLEATAKMQSAEVKNSESIARHLYKLAEQLRIAESAEPPSQMQ